MPLIKPGVYVDATDTTHSYLLAKVLEVDGNQVLVNYDGWS